MARPFVAGGGMQSKSISDFDPRTLGGCALWLDAADSNTLFINTAGTTLASNGDNVLSWRDKSTNNHLATTSTAPNNVGIVGAVVVRDAVSNRTQLQFGVQSGTLTATTNGSATFTGTTTTNQNTISVITGITGTIAVGMLVTGANIPVGTFIVTYNAGDANATLSNTVPTGATATITGALNTATITLPSRPVVGHSLLTNSSVGGLSGSATLYFIRYVVSYIGTTAIVALATTNALSAAQIVTTTTSQSVLCDLGHTSYRIPDAAIPLGASNSTHFIVHKPSLTYRNQYPVSIGNYSPGGMREMNVSGSTNEITITNVSSIKASTTAVSQIAATLMTGMFSNYIVSGWNNGTPMTGTTTTDLQLSTNAFNTGVGSGLIGSRANTLPAYGLMSEYIQFNRALQNDERQQVEGYLAWKWGLVQNLPVTHPYYYAKAPQSAFQPTSFPSCALWLDAADSNSITRTVSQWTDKSGQDNHLISNASFLSPTYNPSVRGIRFTTSASTPTASILERPTLTTAITSPSITFIGVYRKVDTAVPSSGQRLISTGAPTFDDWNIATAFNVNSNSSVTFTFERGSGSQSTSAVSPALTNTFINSFIINGSSTALGSFNANTQNMFYNGQLVLNNQTGLSNGTNFNIQRLRLGLSVASSTSTPSSGYNGFIFEVLLYNQALTLTQVQQIEGYLAWKWGLVASLPAGHPHKNAQPFGFSPTSITGCQLWLDAADLTKVSLNLTQWNDKSGNGFNAVNSGTPTYNAANREISLASGAGFSFSGPNAIIQVVGANPIGGYTSFVVFNTPDTFATTGRILGLWDGSGNDYTGPNGLAIIYLNNSGGVNGLVTSQRGSAYPTTVNALNVSTTYLGTVTSTAGGSFSVGINGETTGNLFATSSTASGNYNTLTRYFIGRNSVNGEALNGTIREVILFSTTLTLSQRQQVEGYLGWKWGLQSNLPATHPFTIANYFFNNTRPMTRNFVPPDIDGCQLWIDAADGSAVTLNESGNVTSIIDKSGLGNNVTPNATSTITNASTLNSRPVLTFPSGGTVAGNILSTASLTRDPVNFSAFYVCRYPSSGANPMQVVNFDLSTATSTSISAASNASSTVLTVTSSTGFAIGRYVLISGVTPTGYNQTGLITAISSSTSITVELSLNAAIGSAGSGGTITQLTASQMFGHNGRATNYNIQDVNFEAGTASRAVSSFSYSAPTLTNNTFVLGCVRQNGVFTLSTNGIAHTTASTGFTATGNKTSGAYSIFGGLQGLDIGEVIVYNSALTDSERQTIEGYLSWKWGIQRATNLTNPSVSAALAYPTTHPYYNFPPVDATPMTPALRLYKKPFDPADSSPVIWIDPQDSTAVTRDETTNRVTQIVNKGSFAGNFTPPTGISGPLATRSSIGNGTNVDFLDFSSGGHYQVTSATMEDATTMSLTVYPPHGGNIPETTGFVVFTPSRGTYSDNTSATTSVGPFAILTATISAADSRTMTITTVNPHGIGNSQSVYLTINTGTFFGTGDASGLTGEYTTHTSGNSGSTITIVFGTNQTSGIMAIADGHVRNNTGTAGPYITKTGTTGSTVKLTTYGSRAIGNLNDFMGRIEYGSIPIGSGEIGSSTVTLSSVTGSVFTASDVTGIRNGTPLIPGSTVGALTSGTMYYVTALSGSTFKLATTLGNALAASPVTVTMTDNASLNLSTTCYGTRVTLRTPIDHAIPSNQLVNINLANSQWLPYQTAPTADTTLNPAMIQFKTATISSSTILRIDLSTMPTGTQNPFFALVSNVPTYTSRGTFTINFPAGTLFGDGTTSAADITISNLTTSSGTANNNATNLEFTIPSRPNGAMIFNGLPGILYCTSNLGTANALQLNFIATSTSVSGNTITCPTPTTYPGVGGTPVHNIGRLLRQFGTSADASLSGPLIYYPINGRGIQNTALSGLNSSTQTIIWVSHLTGPINRWGRIGTGTQPPVIATATTVDGSGGATSTDYAIRMAAFANAPRYATRYNNVGNVSNNPSQIFFTDTSNPFRVNTAYLNLSATAVGDCPAYSRGESMGGNRYDSAFYNQGAGGAGPTRIIAGISQATLSLAHIRIGGDTSVGSTYSTTTNQLNGHWYEGGTGDILIFNRILPTEERQLVEGYLAQKYRTTGSVGGSAIVLNSSAIYNITGTATTTGTSPNFTITLTGTFTTAFQPGTRVTVANVTTNTGLNGTWTVVSCNTTTLTFLAPTSLQWASGNGGTVTGITAIISGNSIHPYRLNSANITGQNTLDLTSTTSLYAQSLVAWFDAANPNLINNTTLPANGTPPADDTAVTRWAPTSGWWANTPLQLANSGTVTYYSSTSDKIHNGLPGIYIGGSTNRLTLATATGAFSQYTTISNNNNFTWMVVFRPDLDTPSATTPVISVTSGTLNRLMLCSNGTFIYSNGTTSQTLTPSTALSGAKTHMITVYRDGTTLGYRIVSEDTTIGSNGFLAGTATQSNLAIPTFNTPTLTFGAIGVTDYTTSFTGSIFEVALFRSAMPLQSMQQVGGYLAHKWGLQGSLPDSHAYKRIPT
jgi:hypothetical protein